ncbi:ScyD/ScyE family protein [Pengzhenrongella sicca]|uniref:ScyD/ScyE family protein n=1 Tax=Pengzhenrongella sicca TaxID=2819238 RepID=A0A8A4ZEK8_9MICO|nr:ScyD/ScyE family protein [Pengzhenrongella sicca]QTE28927.1 ScyD/ScyE family protein [Pengzhenrongella sicca]
MRRSTTTAAVASLATAGLLALGTIPAAAAAQPPDPLARHNVFRALGADDAAAAKRGGNHHSPAPGPKDPVTVAEGLAGPLSFAVGGRSTLYVGQAFSGALTVLAKGKDPIDLVSSPGTDIAAVAVDHGGLTWAESVFGEEGVLSAVVKHRTKRGVVSDRADLLAYELANNPDAGSTYGFQGLAPECAALVPPFLQSYTGLIDSHPYGAAIGRYGTYVADAGSNALLKIDYRGRVSTVAVLPGKTVQVTAEAAAALGIDACVVGADFILEPVPTDVEIGPDGKLYVTSLPGGPEDGSLGANGSLYRVNPQTGAVQLVATGFAGATGLAIAPNGTMYVAELFGGQVSAVSRYGTVTPFASLTEPAGLEWARGRLYVSTNVLTGPGSIVTLGGH